MPIEIVPFTPALLPAVQTFSEATWNRPKSESYYRWRYLECVNQKGLLAMQDHQCVAMLWVFAKPYQVGQVRMTILEIEDWFCLSDMRGFGLGPRLMKEMMNGPDPMLNVGGSEDTRRILPRFDWKPLDEVHQYFLPLEGDGLGRFVKEKTGIPAVLFETLFNTTARGWFKPRRWAAPPGGSVDTPASFGQELPELFTEEKGDRMIPLPDLAFLNWLLAAPKVMGSYVPLYFRIQGKLRGWSLSRVCDTPQGRAAYLLDWYAPPQEERLLPWILSETLIHLSTHRPYGVFAGSSITPYRNALKQNHFLHRAPRPVHFWSREPVVPAGGVFLGDNTSDTALLPYPSE